MSFCYEQRCVYAIVGGMIDNMLKESNQHTLAHRMGL